MTRMCLHHPGLACMPRGVVALIAASTGGSRGRREWEVGTLEKKAMASALWHAGANGFRRAAHWKNQYDIVHT